MKVWRWIVISVLLPSFSLAQMRVSVDVRMVEVYVSVKDEKERPVVNLQEADFRVLEDGRPQEIRIFEPASSAITLALLIDTTGSVANELPHVKNAIIRLLTSVESDDSIGLFTFARNLTSLSNFTTDRKAMLGAILRTSAAGNTALFDSLAQLSREMSRIDGKKAILLFTDGDDNISTISLEASIKETKRGGIPIFAMLYGRALTDSKLLKRLEGISKSSGGTPFRVRQADDLPSIIHQIGEDLQHSYLLGYQSDNVSQTDWRALKVELPSKPKLNIKAKDGYSR
jgi:Ca-activated chloride channel family protein